MQFSHLSVAPSLIVALAITGGSLAQAQAPSFYVDFTSATFGFGTPSAAAAAAAPAPGVWNDINSDIFALAAIYTTGGLTDTAGNPTGVTLTIDAFGGRILDYDVDEPSTMGDDEALMDDGIYFLDPGELRFDGLPPGEYEVITYAMASDDPAARTSVDVVGSPTGLQIVGGDFSAGYSLGATHARHTVTVVAGQPLTIQTDEVIEFDSINGVQVFPSDGTSGIGVNYCGPAVLNSTGTSGEITASGSTTAATNDLTLTASNLPVNAFGFFIVSLQQGFISMPGGSQGNLCLGGAIGRYVGPGQIQNSGAAGEFSLTVDLTQTPQPQGFVAIGAGQTWNFQAWHRDTIFGAATSNFTNGLEITFD